MIERAPIPTAAGRRRRFWSVPMGVLLGGSFGLIVLISVAVVVGLSAVSNYQNTYTLLNDKAILLMRTLTDRVYVHLDPAEQAVRQVAALYADHAIALDNEASRDAVIAGMLAASDVFDAIVVYDLDMRPRGFYRSGDGKITKFEQRPAVEGEIPALLRKMTAKGGAHWGPLVFVENDSFVNVSAPLVRNGIIDGYVVAAVGADVLSEIVARVGIEDSATTFILYGDRGLFAHSRGDELALSSKLDTGHEAVPLAEAGDPVLDHYAERVPLTPFRRAEKSGVEVSQIDLDEDDDYIVLTRAVSDFGPVPWVIGLYMPQEQIGDEVKRLYGSIGIGVLMLALAVGLSLLIARRIGRSLDRINVEAGHVERFELDEARELPRSRISELDSVSAAFNGMLGGLRAFSLYVPRNLVRRLLHDGFEEATRLHQREATVLFTDIVGFTALSESLSVEQVAVLLNGHFSRLVACVEAEGGIVDKFIGDGMMANWALGDPSADAVRAIKAAKCIAAAVAEENRAAVAAGRSAIRVRVGLHCGRVMVGNLGAADRMNYTMIGDTVNVAARLEALGKTVAPDEECVILASARTVDTVRAAGLDIAVEAVGETTLRGRVGAIDVYRVLCPEDPAPVRVEVTPREDVVRS